MGCVCKGVYLGSVSAGAVLGWGAAVALWGSVGRRPLRGSSEFIPVARGC